MWRLLDLLYSGRCSFASQAGADDLEELIQQLDLDGKVDQLSIGEEIQPGESEEDVMMTSRAMDEVVRRAMSRKLRSSRKNNIMQSTALRITLCRVAFKKGNARHVFQERLADIRRKNNQKSFES